MERNTLEKSRLYRIATFMEGNRPRFIFQDAETLEPSVSISIYEQYLFRKQRSHHSTKNLLGKLVYLFSWAKRHDVELEEMLLNGVALTPIQVRQFTHWLQDIGIIKYSSSHATGIDSYNKIIEASNRLFRWFIQQYGYSQMSANQGHDVRQTVIDSLTEVFKHDKMASRKLEIADDLEEEEIGAIESFLKPINRKDVPEAVAVRDYLTWRLAIEFGLREGEILALRLEDCPHRQQDYIKIVRIEERGSDYFDPRGIYAPRPKTLSRDLGFILKNSSTKKIITDYITKHRVRLVNKNGKLIREPVLEHKFLLLSYFRNAGKPLSGSGMQTLAQQIAKATGVKFHWHLARHAFFNRMYAGIIDHPEMKDKLLDLVYWGGWSDEKSLQRYINKARRERARTALAFWQTGTCTWDALK